MLIKSILIVIFAFFATTGSAQTKLTFSSAKLPIIGTVEEFLRQAYQQIAIEVQFKQYPLERALKQANAGEVDGEAARVSGITKLYPNLIRVPVALYSANISAYSKNRDLKVNGMKSIKSLKIGIVRGSKSTDALTKGLNPHVVNNIPALFGILKKDRVDIVLGMQIIVDAFLRSHPEFSMVHRIDPPLYQIPVFHYLHKKNQHLIPKIQPILEKLTADKVLDKMLAKALKTGN